MTPDWGVMDPMAMSKKRASVTSAQLYLFTYATLKKYLKSDNLHVLYY